MGETAILAFKRGTVISIDEWIYYIDSILSIDDNKIVYAATDHLENKQSVVIFHDNVGSINILSDDPDSRTLPVQKMYYYYMPDDATLEGELVYSVKVGGRGQNNVKYLIFSPNYIMAIRDKDLDKIQPSMCMVSEHIDSDGRDKALHTFTTYIKNKVERMRATIDKYTEFLDVVGA